jgi:chromosome segregation ATPase
VEKSLLAQKIMELESNNTTTQTLCNDLNVAHKQMTVLEQKVENLQVEIKCLSETANHLRDDKIKLEAELEEQKRRNNNLEVASDSFFSFSVCLIWVKRVNLSQLYKYKNIHFKLVIVQLSELCTKL